MFMIPIPPTRRDNTATLPTTTLKVRCVRIRWFRSSRGTTRSTAGVTPFATASVRSIEPATAATSAPSATRIQTSSIR